jgi:hypothetical protein
VKQAYITKGVGPLTLKFGKFVTFVGTEVIDTPANLNYSRAILFTVIPYYHVGLMGTYAVTDSLGVSAYIGNGDSVDTASNGDRDWGLTTSFSGIKGLSTSLIYYNKIEREVGGEVKGTWSYLNLLGSFQVAENLSVAGEYLYKTRIASTETDAAGNLKTTSVQVDPANGKLVAYSPKDQGYALYVNYTTPISGLSLIPRYEQFWSESWGMGPVPANDFTFTVKYVGGPLTQNVEYRMDTTALPYGGFANTAGSGGNKYDQSTITYGVTYSF